MFVLAVCHSRFMTNGMAFSDQQVEQLKELFDERFEAQDIRLVHELDRRFNEQDKRIDQRFTEERSYFRHILREELADIRDRLDKLDQRSDNRPLLQPSLEVQRFLASRIGKFS